MHFIKPLIPLFIFLPSLRAGFRRLGCVHHQGRQHQTDRLRFERIDNRKPQPGRARLSIQYRQWADSFQASGDKAG